MYGTEVMILAIINMLQDEDFETVTIVDKDGNTITYSLPSAHLGAISRETSEDEFSEDYDESPLVSNGFESLAADNDIFGNSETPGYRDTEEGPLCYFPKHLAPAPRGKNRKPAVADPLDISWPGLPGSSRESEPSAPPTSPEFVSMADTLFVPPSPEERLCTGCPKVLSPGFVHARCRACYEDDALRNSGKPFSLCGDDDCKHLTVAGRVLCKGCYRSRLNDGVCIRANCHQTVNYGHKVCRSCYLGDKQSSVRKTDVARAKEHQASQAAKGGKGSKVRAFGRGYVPPKCK